MKDNITNNNSIKEFRPKKIADPFSLIQFAAILQTLLKSSVANKPRKCTKNEIFFRQINMERAAASICMDKKQKNISNKSINISRLLQYCTH